MNGISRRTFLTSTGAAVIAAGAALGAPAPAAKEVKIGFIGVGGRGSYLLNVLLSTPGTSVPAICDINAENLNRAIGIVRDARGNAPEGYSRGPVDYRRMLERQDLDAVLIATPQRMHAAMAIDAMNAGKHVGSEVPGAQTLKECRGLIETKLKTGRRYMLLENYCYACERMMVGNMIKQGVFGEPYYGECSYIHDCNYLRFNNDGTLTWRGEGGRDGFGNTYPTHSMGPVSKWMDINGTDRFVSLVSMETRAAGLNAYVAKKFAPDSEQAKIKWALSGMCVSLVKTEKGRMITVYFDTTSPRPMSIFYLIQGTKGVFDSRKGIFIDDVSPKEEWEPWQKYSEKYDHEYWKTRGKEAAATSHGGGDYFSVSDFVEMVRQDREPWIDVYDSAAWSAIIPLSQKSIRSGGREVRFPDYVQRT
jgi:predicted dehydrogenase